MPLFEVAILEKPTKKELEDGKSERIIMLPTAVIANDSQSAAVIAVMDAKNLGEVDKSKMEIIVRPFA